MANVFLPADDRLGGWGDTYPAQGRSSVATMPGMLTPERAAESNAVTARPKAMAWVRMAPDILRAMAIAANHAGRNAGEVWAEAAREWLLRKSLEADYDMLSNLPARRKEAAALEEKRARMWGTVDSAMADIRPAQRVGWGA